MLSKIFKVCLILILISASSGAFAKKAFACTTNSQCPGQQCIANVCRDIPTSCPSNQDLCDVGSWTTCCAVGYRCTAVNGHNECLRPTNPTQPPDEPTLPPPTPTPTATPIPTPTPTPFPPSPTPTVIPAQCTNIKTLDPNGAELTGNADAALIPGSSAVKFSCAANGAIAKYEFRVILPDGTIQTDQTDPALAAVGSITGSYIIPTAGKLIVQCRVCTLVAGVANPVCQEYEPITGLIPSPTTAPLITCGTNLPACPLGFICDTTVMAGQPRYCIQPPSQ